MKLFILIWTILWSTLSFAALPLKTRGQNDASASGQDTLRLEAPNSQITKIGDQKVLVETGNGNLLVNPNFENSNTLFGWTLPNGGSGWYSDETTALREGKKSVDYYHASSGTGGNIYQQVDPNASMRNQNFEYSLDVRGNSSAATILKVCVLDGPSQTETQCQTVPRDNVYRTYTFNRVPPASGLTGIGIVADSANSFKFDKAYVGPARNIGVGVPNNVFSAKVSASGVVTDENEDWISGNCTNAAPAVCTFVSGKFAVQPNCTVSFVNTVNNYREIGLQSVSTTGLNINRYDSAGNANTNTVNLICTRAGTDFIQPAITPNQWNYGPTAYTPTFGAGFGTPNNVSLFHWRTGKFLNVSGAFTSGTTSAAIGSISLPNGLTIDASALGINNTTSNPGQEVGRFNYPAVNGFGNIVTAPATSTSVVYFATNNVTGTRLTPTSSVSSNALPPTTVTSIFFRVPIAGWTENQNAPQLVGSVTSNATSPLRTESARIGDVSSVCSSTPCTINKSTTSGWLSSVTRTSAGIYTANFASGVFSSEPLCQLTSNANGSIFIRQNGAATTSNMGIVSIASSTGTVVDSSFIITCTGPR